MGPGIAEPGRPGTASTRCQCTSTKSGRHWTAVSCRGQTSHSTSTRPRACPGNALQAPAADPSDTVSAQLQTRTHADEHECWIVAGFDVVPLWYHVVMAMNLRLDDDDSALLKALAEAEHVSMHEAALRAIRRSARELAHTDRVREATAEMLDRWGGVLDRLGRA